MRRIRLLSLVLGLLLAGTLVSPAVAHQPFFEEKDIEAGNPWEIEDPSISTALYATLALRGYFPLEELEHYGEDDSRLMTHVSHHVPGVEFSTGSLGHGLPFAAGKALAAKRSPADWRTFVLLSDGELNEGSNWEAILFAGHHRLDNLVAIIDCNGVQSLGSISEVLELEPLAEKFRAFGWHPVEVDGHDHDELKKAFDAVSDNSGKPTVLLARTVKGKGVNFMENELLWHYRNPGDDQLAEALRQLENA
jgi:transketolase